MKTRTKQWKIWKRSHLPTTRQRLSILHTREYVCAVLCCYCFTKHSAYGDAARGFCFIFELFFPFFSSTIFLWLWSSSYPPFSSPAFPYISLPLFNWCPSIFVLTYSTASPWYRKEEFLSKQTLSWDQFRILWECTKLLAKQTEGQQLMNTN